MKYSMRIEATGQHVIMVSDGHYYRPKFEVRTILDCVSEIGGWGIMLANSHRMTNWTLNIQTWLQQPEATVDYICNRVPFDEIHCATKSEADLIFKRLEQLEIFHALRRDYQ